MSVPSSLVPDGMVPEVTSARIILQLADGTVAEAEIPKARWVLGMTTRDASPPEMSRNPEPIPPLVEHWWWVGFRPIDFRNPTWQLVHITDPDLAGKPAD